MNAATEFADRVEKMEIGEIITDPVNGERTTYTRIGNGQWRISDLTEGDAIITVTDDEFHVEYGSSDCGMHLTFHAALSIAIEAMFG